MKVLIVGAGAVGQVFGYHLQRGGAQVTFFVKEKYAAAARAGFTLYNLGRGREALSFEGFGVVTSAEEVAGEPWDLVLLTVASPALRAGDWLSELAAATGDATLAGLQPGLGDAALVREIAGEDRVVWGVIELIAYQAPLKGEDLGAGVAFWIPWWLIFPFSGPDARTQAVVSAFRAGGLRSRQVADTVTLTATGSPVLNLHIAALEAAGWSLSAVRADRELLRLTHAATREAVAVAAHEHGVPVPLWTRLVRPWQVRLLAWLAPRVMPLDVETYLQFHFTKVGEQTQEQLERWSGLARERGLSHQALDALRDRRERGAPSAPPALQPT